MSRPPLDRASSGGAALAAAASGDGKRGRCSARRSQGVDDPSGRGRRRGGRRRTCGGGGGGGGSGGGGDGGSWRRCGFWAAAPRALESNPLATTASPAAASTPRATSSRSSCSRTPRRRARTGVAPACSHSHGAVLVGPAATCGTGRCRRSSLPPAPPGPLPRASPSRSTSSRSRPASRRLHRLLFTIEGNADAVVPKLKQGLAVPPSSTTGGVGAVSAQLFVPVNLHPAANAINARVEHPTCPTCPTSLSRNRSRPGEGEEK